MSLLLAITSWDTAPWGERFRRLAPDRDIRIWPDTGDPSEIRYVASWKAPQGMFTGLPRLEAIFNLGAGVDALMADESLPNVPIVRVVDPNLTQRMTEYVALHALADLRRQRIYDEQARAGLWRPHQQPAAPEVTVGLMGLGVLGQACAATLLQLGFRVIGWSRSRKAVADIETFAGQDELDRFLAQTDLLVCLLPLTAETRGMLDRGLFERLRRDGALGGPALINAGRGGLQVEADILAALDRGILRHAVLDVFETEPLPADNPLWRHPGVTVTPHVAADSEPDAIARYVIGQIEAHERGEPLQNVIDRSTGY